MEWTEWSIHSISWYLEIASGYQSIVLPRINEIRNSTIKIKNNTFAIPAAPTAIPPNPNKPAIIATIKNIIVHRNIIINFSLINCFCIMYWKIYAANHCIDFLSGEYFLHNYKPICLQELQIFYCGIKFLFMI